MKQVKSTQDMSEAKIKFWERYAVLLNKDGITGYKAAYMIQRAQEFTYSLEGKRLKSVEEKDVEQWLGELGRNSHFESWQLVQAHEAVRFLLTRMLPNSNPPRPSSLRQRLRRTQSATPPMEGNSDVPKIDWNRLSTPKLLRTKYDEHRTGRVLTTNFH